ncbi:bifunctional enoyl-CoA hydratase/phosphate acetyltransferase [Anoxynatronum buryatiense]|uniref:Phosphate butyryltransferase n=1 Tax=Anoxynatronum buryatiense TaxID=489973 RepID=A0AA46AH87_9CLOT|nr:bifunctional enoyl-CoA hydratase/phosphate acetyltransferase [Anoxynatronum buryatiense]SMP37664.1 phosphate butyryltransferase [Anoxynatronum buryatiense]
MIRHMKSLIENAAKGKRMSLAVAAAEDKDVLLAVKAAIKSDLISAQLFGDETAIRRIAAEIELDLQQISIIPCDDFSISARKAVQAVSDRRADFLMKGLLDTSILLKEVLDKDFGLRTDRLLSHVMIYEPAAYHKFLLLTDGGMNITPSLDQKQMIITNAVEVAKALEISPVKVACVTAKEKVSEKMTATVDAAALKEMQKQGVFGDGVVIEGPIALDLAVSKEACRIKGFESPVGGDADILLVPTIEVGNGIGKTLTYMAQAPSAGIIMGAKVPVVLVSRADSAESKLYSIALGSVIAAKMR